MIDEIELRRVLREEIGRILPRLREPTKSLLSIPECMKRYGHTRQFYQRLIAKGELDATFVENGRNGLPQHFVKVDSAERHPALGGGR